MMLSPWDKLPESFHNESVKRYYDSLSQKKCSLFFKRVFDVAASAIMIILLSPVLLIVGICIKADSSGPVFFRQERVTSLGRTFRIFKFRTMVDGADKKGSLVTVTNDSRITDVGKKIRSCRLDEVPQLINVLLGDMSFVGTRPEVRKYTDAYTQEMLATLLLPAGVTSMASVKFKDEDDIIARYTGEGLTVDQVYVEKTLPMKMEYNLEEILDFSFFRDIKTLFTTLFAVLKR